MQSKAEAVWKKYTVNQYLFLINGLAVSFDYGGINFKHFMLRYFLK